MRKFIAFVMIGFLFCATVALGQETTEGFRFPSIDTLPFFESAAKSSPEIFSHKRPKPPPPPPKLWEGSFELGLNGLEGNSQAMNFRFGADIKRQTEQCVLSTDFDYNKNSTDSLETAHRAFLDWRYEWLFQDSPWTWYVHGSVDYDEFKAFDLRVSIDSGLGYQFIKTDTCSFLGRFGAGASREIGGPDDAWIPELVFGLELEKKISDRQKIAASVEYTPAVSDFTDYRITSKVSWEVILDEATNLSLKVSLLDRYDSTPHGLKPNDLDYAITLLWSY